MRDLFPNAWHVARREFNQRVRTRTFAIVTALLVALGLGLALLPIGVRLFFGDDQQRIGVYATAAVGGDTASALEATLQASGGPPAGGSAPRYVVETIADREAGRDRVRDGELDGLLSLDRAGGELTFDYFTDAGAASQDVFAVRSAATQLNIADRLARAGLDPSEAGQVFAPTPFALTPVDPIATNEEDTLGPRYLLATALVVVTFMAILLYGQWVATGVAEEKSSRVMELLVTAATPRQLLAGKVLGNGAAGLTQYGVVLGAALVGLLAQGFLAELLLGDPASSLALEALDPVVLLVFGAFFLSGFLLYATLYAGLGSLASRQEDVQQVTGPLIILATLGYLAAFAGLATPEADWIKLVSLIPFFSPYMLPARMVLASVAPWEWAVAAGLMVAFLAGVLWLAARIYSAGVLLYGQRPGVRAIWRAVRVDR